MSTWIELDKKKEGNKEVIYRSYTIKSNYIKLNDCFKFGYDLLDNESTLTWIQNTYWRLENYSCVTVPYNKDWFNMATPHFKDLWKIIEKERVGSSILPQATYFYLKNKKLGY